MKKYMHIINRYISFIFGLFLVAIAFNVFLSPNTLVPGGVSGIAIILENFLGLSPSIVILIAGIILLILSFFLLGIKKTRASILGTLLFPLCVDLTANLPELLNIYIDNLLLAAIFGAALYGFGAGIIFKAGFTTGGTDILNQIISKYFKISIGKSMLCSDGFIVLSSVFVFGINMLLYSAIILYIVSIMSDKVIMGISDNKAFYIVTNKEEEIREYILKSLGHGATIFKGKGGFNENHKNVIMCVIPTKNYYHLKEGIHKIDTSAFFVVTDAYEVFGGE